jgi:hypothetical protein
MEKQMNKFTYGKYVVEYLKRDDGLFDLCINSDNKRVCLNGVRVGLHVSENYDMFQKFREAGLEIDSGDFQVISRNILYGETTQKEEKTIVSQYESQCESLGFIVIGKNEYELLRCSHGIDMVFPKDENEERVTIYAGVPNVKLIRDKYLNDEVYIYTNNYNQVFITNDPAELIEWFVKSDKGITSESMAKALIRALLRNAKTENDYIYQGFYPDGFHDGALSYPMMDKVCDATVLQRFFEWSKENYEENLYYVLANMAFAIAKVFTPALRMQKDIFEDRIVINTGKKRIGKSTVQKSIINALGLIHNKVRLLGDNPIKTQERLRNLLSIDMAPLFLDELMTRGFQTISDLILASTTETSIIGLHASRVGKDFSDIFYSMRSLIVNTNLPQGKIIEILGKDNIDAYSRRILILHWKDQKTKAKSPFSTNTHIMGCLIEMWNNPNIRNELLKTNNIFELAMAFLKHFFLVYGIDTQPYQEALTKVYNEYIESESSWEISTEEAVLSEAYKIARNVLGMQSLTPAKLINAIIDNPEVFDTYPYKARYNDSITNELTDFEKLITDLGYNISDIEGDTTPNEETAQLLKKIYKMINNDGIYSFLIKPRSKTGLLKDFPHEFLGKKPIKVKAQWYFKVNVTEFVRFMLQHRVESENEENN